MTAIEVSDELAAVLITKAAEQGLTLDTWLKKLIVETDAPESEQEEKVKIEWLRTAAKEGFDAIEQGDCATLVSDDEVSAFMKRIHEDVEIELAAERRIG